ncbi:hypothetical protein PVAND_015769 [Polypedilum vanderplanki]|uniref:Uncharacterized protein n=1 Tax=Polypedilum vanderplanki TaxID=319348 RepID=A0A9J6BDX9_POLVA|nr:hypothetical protein PVAND_015769 [Polypedilum vanderplanki]
MDEFIVVVFTIDDSCAVIRKDWLVDEKSLFFPPTNEYNQAIKGKPKSSQRTWIVYDIVIQKKFATQRDADLYCKTMSDVGTSSDELQIQRSEKLSENFRYQHKNTTSI